MSYLLSALREKSKEKTAGLPRALRNQLKSISKHTRQLTQKVPIRNWDDLDTDYMDRFDYAYPFRVNRFDPRANYKTRLIATHLTGKNFSNYINPNINLNRLPFTGNRRLPFTNNRREGSGFLAFQLASEQGHRPVGLRAGLARQARLEKGYRAEANSILQKRMDDLKKQRDARFEESMKSYRRHLK